MGKNPYDQASPSGTYRPDDHSQGPPPPNYSSGGGGYAPPPGPPPGRGDRDGEYAPPPGPPPGRRDEEYAPPPGPPPRGRSGQGTDYAPPPGPPPSGRSNQTGSDYAPPAGPPPGRLNRDQADYASPPGPPPRRQAEDDWIRPPTGPPPPESSSQPQHDWQSAVPDTSLFPPPPALFSGYERSPSSNATEQEATAGQDWCERYPLTKPLTLDAPGRAALSVNNIGLIEPAGFSGKLNWLGPGRWEGKTKRNSPDRCIIGYPPLYVVREHDPAVQGRAKTIYYEVKVRGTSPNNFVAVGFTALPYPSFRMPGWHRGSLAVHGDDGHKYVNDTYGGKEFTGEFRKGETVGVGMTFRPARGGGRPEVEVFFTREGRKVGGWDLHEEIDQEQDGPVTGLEGFHDLSCAVGTYDAVDFEVVFDRRGWLYKGVEG